jgi:hypothetical protein
MQMKKRGDFTTPGNNEAAIAASRASGAPVDGFLSTNELSEGAAAASEMKSSPSGTATMTMTKEQEAQEVAAAEQAMKQRRMAAQAETRQAAEAMYGGDSNDLAYARDIEITNGRWAMIGFLTAVVVEAQTGQGIIGQLIGYAKASGLLGAKSGF